jgi:hypothetical protein
MLNLKRANICATFLENSNHTLQQRAKFIRLMRNTQTFDQCKLVDAIIKTDCKIIARANQGKN